MSLELERERTVQTLCSHFAQDHLSTQELETRFERVYRAKSFDELRALTAGLPALATTGPDASVAPSPMYAMASPGVPPLEEKRYLAVMSEVRRQGLWEVPKVLRVKAVMGSIRLDLRDASLPPGGVDIDATAIMGDIRVILPPGVRADVDGLAIMGEFTDKSTVWTAATASTPVIRVSGSVFMGAVKVETRLPNEGSLQAWKRRFLKG